MERRTIMLQEIRKMKFEELYARYERNELTSEQAAEYLCCSERTFRRMRFRYEEDRTNGLADRRIGHIPPNKVAADEIEKLLIYTNPDNNVQARCPSGHKNPAL